MELSVMMYVVYICTVQYGSLIQNMHSETEELNFKSDLILI